MHGFSSGGRNILPEIIATFFRPGTAAPEQAYFRRCRLAQEQSPRVGPLTPLRWYPEQVAMWLTATRKAVESDWNASYLARMRIRSVTERPFLWKAVNA